VEQLGELLKHASDLADFGAFGVSSFNKSSSLARYTVSAAS
jgi:hypothetical protein